MKALEISELFRAAFAADIAFSAATPPIKAFNDQSAADFSRPCVVFAVAVEAMNGTGSALDFTLIASVESPAEKKAEADPDPATAHKTRVDLVRAKLLGAGKAALLTALNTGHGFDFRGWSGVGSDPSNAGRHFVTPITVHGIAKVL